MTLSPSHAPSSKAELLSSASAASLAVNDVMNRIASLNIPITNKLSDAQYDAIARNLPEAANDNRAPISAAA